jgi:hypothetical protein
MSEESILFTKLCSAYSNMLCESTQNKKQKVCEDELDDLLFGSKNGKIKVTPIKRKPMLKPCDRPITIRMTYLDDNNDTSNTSRRCRNMKDALEEAKDFMCCYAVFNLKFIDVKDHVVIAEYDDPEVENFDNIEKDLESWCDVDESDILHRHPSEVVPHGKAVRDGLYGDDSLDLRINQRGKASDLRDYEVSKASHYDNLIRCYDDNAEVLKKVADILEKENEDRLAHDLKNIIDGLEELRDESEFQKDRLQSEINQSYHVGDRYSSDYVDHEKPYYS